ncbi:MAG: DUF4416 family protein [Gemmatimonadota bacterium]|nr:DUF4416 family protein [Gemmatimonadota bacterium]
MAQDEQGSPAREQAQPVKLFVTVLYREEDLLEQARRLLTGLFGPEDSRSAPFPFDHTDFYTEEMGEPLSRIFISYERLVHPQYLVAAKLEAARIEAELAGPGGKRRVNIDPGTLDYLKVVLASFKFMPYKIYLDRGVWADLTLYYRKGGWEKFEWTFPDFKTGRFDKTLLGIRRIYKRQRLETSSEPE